MRARSLALALGMIVLCAVGAIGAPATPAASAGHREAGPTGSRGPRSSLQTPAPTGSTRPSTSAGSPGSTAARSPNPPDRAARGHAEPVPNAVVTRAAHNDRSVALTFDDGPDPIYTPQVLDLLARYGVHATFCMVGDAARAHPDLVRRVVADGHRLCDHTMTHDLSLGSRSASRIRYEIIIGRATLETLAGTQVRYYRQPGGRWTARIRRTAAAQGLVPLGWSVDPRDWSRPGVDVIVQRVKSQLRPGGVILLHDGGGDPSRGETRVQTVRALAILIPWLIQQQYRFDFPATPAPAPTANLSRR